MQVDIKHRDHLTETETTALNTLKTAVYPPDETADDGASQFQWASPTWRALVRDGNQQLVARVGLLTRQGKCDDETVLIGGIGGVATHPLHRQKGYAGAGIKQAVKFLREEQKVDFSLLVCRDALFGYYQRLGWQRFHGTFYVQQPSGKIEFTFNKPMTIAGMKTVADYDVIDLCGKPW